MNQKLVIASLVGMFSLGSAFAKPAISKATPKPTAKETPKPSAIASYVLTPVAKSADDASPNKPELTSILKDKSIKRVVDEFDVITNSEYLDNDDFAFVNAVLIRAPMRYARPIIMDFKIYPKMSSAIKKIEYDEKTQLLEVEGEASGLHMHSWVKVDQRYWDEIRYDIVRGDMKGFKIAAYLYEKEGKTLAVAKGLWPQGKKAFSPVIALLFKPVSEVVIGVATKNFRSYIEEEYKLKKSASK